MAVELAELNIPLRATGRDAVLQAFAEIDRAGAKAGQPVTVPVSAPGAAAAAKQLEALGGIAGVVQKAIAQLNREVGTSGQYGAGLTAIRERITLLQKGVQLEATNAESVRKLQGAEGQLETALTRGNLTLKERILLGEQLARVQALLATQTQAVARPVDAVAAGMGRATAGANAWAAGLAALRTQQVGIGAAGALADSGLRRMTSGLQQLAVVALGTRSAVGQLATGALLSFGASAALTLGVVAGIAAIALAWDKLTESSRKAEEQLKKAREELERSNPQQLAAERVAILQAAITKAEAGLQRLAQGDRSIGLPAASSKDIAKARAELDLLRRDLVKAQAEAVRLGQTQTDESIAALTKAIELRTASTFQIRQALALLPQLRAAAADETKTLAERNAAAQQANALQAAFDAGAKKEAKTRQEQIDALRNEAALLGEIASQRALTTAEVDRLRAAYVAITKALEDKNTTDRQQLELLRAQRQALAELAAQTSASFTTKGSTFGQDLTLGRPKPPSLAGGFGTFGADQDRTAQFFAGGALDTFTDDLTKQADRAGTRVTQALAGVQDQIDANLDQLHTRLAAGLTQSLIDGITQGFEQGLASGSIAKGAEALAAQLLSGLGDAAIQFGVASLGIADLMAKIKASLASLNPAAAIPAALALIALGGLLKGAAARAFGGAGGGGGGAATIPTRERDQTIRIIVGRDGEVLQRTPSPASQTVTAPPTAARQAASVEPRPSFVFAPNVFGRDDQQLQRQMVEFLNAAAGRGYWIARRP